MSDEEFLIEGTKFTYEGWAEAAVDDIVHHSWEMAGRKIETWTIEILGMNAKKEGFKAVVKGGVTENMSIIFEVKYDREMETTTVITYHPVDVLVRTPDPQFRLPRF